MNTGMKINLDRKSFSWATVYWDAKTTVEITPLDCNKFVFDCFCKKLYDFVRITGDIYLQKYTNENWKKIKNVMAYEPNVNKVFTIRDNKMLINVRTEPLFWDGDHKRDYEKIKFQHFILDLNIAEFINSIEEPKREEAK